MGRKELMGKIKAEGRQTKKELKVNLKGSIQLAFVLYLNESTRFDATYSFPSILLSSFKCCVVSEELKWNVSSGASSVCQFLVCGAEHVRLDHLLLHHLDRAHLLPVMADERAQVPSHHRPLTFCHEVLPRRMLSNCIHNAHR